MKSMKVLKKTTLISSFLNKSSEIVCFPSQENNKKNNRKLNRPTKILTFSKLRLFGDLLRVSPKKKTSLQQKFERKNRKKNMGLTLKFIDLLRLLMKIKNLFKSRTTYRTLKHVNDNQIEMINDLCYFTKRKEENEFSKRRFTEKNVFFLIFLQRKKTYFFQLTHHFNKKDIKRAFYRIIIWLSTNFILVSFENLLKSLAKFLDTHIPVIKPNQKGKVLWDILILLTILYWFFIIPVQIGFDINCQEKLHHYLIIKNFSGFLAELIVLIPEILLIIDTILKFITGLPSILNIFSKVFTIGYYENGLVITKKSHICEHYLKKGLIFDLLSYCPILAQSMFSQTSFALKILQLLMFSKIKRIRIIISNFEEMISLEGQNDYILSLIRLFLQIIFFAHIIACIWHGTAIYNNVSAITWLDYSHTKEMTWFD